MTYLKLFIFILVLFDKSQAKVTSVSDSQDPSLLANYAMRRAREMGITNDELITGLKTLRNNEEGRSSRKLLFKSDTDEYELQKQRDEELAEMGKEIETNLNQMVINEEENDNDGDDESEMDKISDLYLRTRDYIDKVKIDLKDSIDNIQHDLDVQLIEHQNAVQNHDN